MVPPSIFNDVIGPVMRGPSSSHCAAAVRIGRLARDLMGGRMERVLLEFDSRGSLAFTHASQGSDMGIFGGLLGWDPHDERLLRADLAVREAGIRVDIRTGDFGDPHPNTYRITLESARETHRMIALSTGGGMIEITALDGIPLRFHGDYCETLMGLAASGADLLARLRATVEAEDIHLWEGKTSSLIEIKTRTPLNAAVLSRLGSQDGVVWVRTLSPVLPILSRKGMRVPFITCAEMLDYNRAAALDLGELGVRYESARGGISEREVFERMLELVRILRGSIAEGIRGTRYDDRILGCQSAAFKSAKDQGTLLNAGMLNTMILYVTALMEVKSAMGVIVAAPTAGSCGALPGAVVAAADHMGLPEQETAKAMLAAGLIGVFIAAQATFAAEVCGCQAECGAGSSMAAAALTTLAGGSVRQAVDAASMAMQNTLGLICDPVANRVEVPCLGRNVLAAINALACANMALAGFDVVIPLDEVIETMSRVGRSLPVELRCTALGGLSVTASSKKIAKRLASGTSPRK
jgi:L-serine dehydratase